MALVKAGALWKGKPGSKAVLTGSIELDGKKWRALVFRNEDKEGKQPDYRIMTDPDDVEAAGATKAKAAPKPDPLEEEAPF